MKQINPFFSIITPFYNAENFIYLYLERLKKQTFKNWECILIDDYSNDNGYEIVKNSIKNEKRIKIFKNQLPKKIKGPYQARNFGISLAKGNFICFLDIDDYWFEEMLELKYQILQESGTIDLIFTNYLKCKKDIAKKVIPIKFIPIRYQLRIHNPIGMLTSTIRRNLIINQKFKSINHEDYLFWAEIFNKNKSLKLKHIPQILAVYTESENSISSNKFLSIKWHYNCYLKLGYGSIQSALNFIPLILIKSLVWIRMNIKIIKISKLNM